MLLVALVAVVAHASGGEIVVVPEDKCSWVSMVRDVGFPVMVAGFLLWRQDRYDRTLRAMAAAISSLQVSCLSAQDRHAPDTEASNERA